MYNVGGIRVRNRPCYTVFSPTRRLLKDYLYIRTPSISVRMSVGEL